MESFYDYRTIDIRQYNLMVYEHKRGHHGGYCNICFIGFAGCTGRNSFHSIGTCCCFLSHTTCPYGVWLAMAGSVVGVEPDCCCCCCIWSTSDKSNVCSTGRIFCSLNTYFTATNRTSHSTCSGYEYAISNTDSRSHSNFERDIAAESGADHN